MEDYTKLGTLARKFHLLDVFAPHSLEPIRVCVFFLEDLSLPNSHFVQDDLQPLGINDPALIYVAI
jgi:hypothetical protein